MARRDLEVRVRADVGAYQKAMSAAVSSTDELAQSGLRLQKLGLSVSNLGDTLTKNVTLPLVAIGGAAVVMASNFDKSFTTMQTLAGLSAGEVDALKESVLDLSGKTGRAPQELAEALYFLRSSGLSGAQAMDALEQSAKASAAGLGETQSIADAVSSAMLGYAKSGLTAAEATDVLVATAREGKAEPAELASQMGRLVPIASELGITFGDVGGAIAALSTKGFNAEQATTALVNVMGKLLKPSEQAKQLLEEVGLSTDTIRKSIADKGLLATLEELKAKLGDAGFVKFLEDQQAVQGGLALLGGDLEATRDIIDAVNDSAGATDNAFSIWADSMGAQNAQAFATFQVALIQLGDVIAPIASDILGFVSQLVSLFSELPQGVQTAVVAFAALAAATGPFLSVSGRLLTAFGTMQRLLSDFVLPAGAVSGAFSSSAVAAEGLTTRLAPLATGISIIGPLAIGAGIALKAYTDTKAEAVRLTDLLTDALEAEASGLEGAADAALGAELTTGDLGSKLRDAGADLDVFNDAIRNSGEALEKMDDEAGLIGTAGLSEVLDRAGLSGSAFADELLRVTENMSTGEVIELVDRLDGLSDRYDEASTAAEEAAATEGFLSDQHSESSTTVNGLTVEIGEATSALEAYSNTLKAMFDPLFGLINAQQELAGSQVAITEAQNALNTAIAEHGPASEEAADAQRALEDAQWAGVTAAYGLEQAQIAAAQAAAEEGLSVDQARQRGYQWAAQAGLTGAAADAVAEKFANAAAEGNAYATDYGATISATDRATGVIRPVKTELNDLDGRTATVTVNARTVWSTIGQAFGILGRQHGGPVSGGRLYEVAEQGRAELLEMAGRTYLIPGSDGTVVPAGAWAGGGMSGGGSGGGVQHVHEHIYVQVDGATVAQADRNYKRDNGLDWRT